MKLLGTKSLGVIMFLVVVILPISTTESGTRLATGILTSPLSPLATSQPERGSGNYHEIVSFDVNLVSCIAWSPDGTRLAMVDFPMINILNTASWQNELTISDASVNEVVWSPDGNNVASVAGGEFESLYIWDVHTGQLVDHLMRPYDGPPGIITINRLSWSPDGQRIASDSYNLDVLIWDLNTNEVSVLGNHEPNGVVETDWSLDSKWLVSGGADFTTRIWEVDTGENVITVEGGGFVDWHPTENRIAGTIPRGEASIWDSNSGERLLTVAHGSSILSVRWNHNGKLIATGGLDSVIKVWNAQTGELVASIDNHLDSIRWLAWHPSQNLLASSSYDGHVRIWRID